MFLVDILLRSYRVASWHLDERHTHPSILKYLLTKLISTRVGLPPPSPCPRMQHQVASPRWHRHHTSRHYLTLNFQVHFFFSLRFCHIFLLQHGKMFKKSVNLQLSSSQSVSWVWWRTPRISALTKVGWEWRSFSSGGSWATKNKPKQNTKKEKNTT